MKSIRKVLFLFAIIALTFSCKKEKDDVHIMANTCAQINKFSGKVYKTGGLTSGVYSSVNGTDWNLELENAPFGQRYNHSCVVYDDKLWLISGSDQLIEILNEIPDVWYTEDGESWIRASEDAGFVPIAQSTAVSLNQQIFLIGGGGGWMDTFVTNDIYLID